MTIYEILSMVMKLVGILIIAHDLSIIIKYLRYSVNKKNEL